MAVFYLGPCVGSGSAPWIAQGTRKINDMLPFILLGSLLILGGIACCVLKETRNEATREILEES